MCRLFGFRSVVKSMVHRSMVAANNSMSVQSSKHPDGWGVAYYLGNRVPHVVKSSDPALEDKIFNRVSGVVASETVIAHIRQATTGSNNSLNSHPFQFGNWTFAHNGQIWNYEEHKKTLRNHIAPGLRRYILGDTDSEVLFFIFLTQLQTKYDLFRRGAPIRDIVSALSYTYALVQDIADGPFEEEKSMINTLLTDGTSMVGCKLRRPLRYSTYKADGCKDRDTCPFLAPECENPTKNGHVNHLVIASEDLEGQNTWIPMEDGDVVAVDWSMRLHTGTLWNNVLPVGMSEEEKRQFSSMSERIPNY